MIRLKKEAKKKLNEFIDVATNVLWVACAAISTLVCCITYIFRYYNRYISPGLITFSRICYAIMIICLIPAVYLIVKNIVKNIIDSFEVVPRKTKKEKMLEERDKKLQERDKKLQNMTIQDLLDYYNEQKFEPYMYEFIIFACNEHGIDKEALVKVVLDQLIDYSHTYILDGYTASECSDIEYDIFEHLLNIYLEICKSKHRREIELYKSELKLI